MGDQRRAIRAAVSAPGNPGASILVVPIGGAGG